MKAPFAQCDKCPLYFQPFAGSFGSPTAEVVFIGEAPGNEEARAGRPFVGPSGKLLHGVLNRLSITEDKIFKTNAVLCQPKWNGINNEPPPDALRCCKPRLDAELALQSSRKIVVTMGSTAMYSLLTPDMLQGGVMDSRGVVYESMDYGKVLVTLHPAYILRQPGAFFDFVKDLRQISPKGRLNIPRNPQTHYQVVESRGGAMGLLRELIEEKEIVFDLETTGYDPVVDTILCAIISPREGLAYVFDGSLVYDELLRSLWALLFKRENGKDLIGHNGKFDVEFIVEQLGLPESEVVLTHDTLLAHYTTDERPGTHDLKKIAAELFGAPDYEGAMKRQYLIKKSDSFAVIPKPELFKYGAYDGDYTMQLYQYQKETLDDKSRFLLKTILMPAQRVFMNMELRGIAVDTEYVEDLASRFQSELDEYSTAMQQVTGRGDFNPASPKQVAEQLYGKAGIPPKTARNGKVTTNKEALEELAEQYPQNELLQLLMKYRKTAKLMGSYVTNMLPLIVDGRVHPDFSVFGTVTGRPTCKDPAMFTIPRSNEPGGKLVKDSFVGPDGKDDWDRVLVQADYRSAELRVVAWLSQDPQLIEFFNKRGVDIHSEVAALMFGPGFTKEDRMRAKMVVFGLSYGREAYSLALQLGCSVREAQSFIDRFFDRMPTVKDWQERTIKEAFSTGTLSTIFGRRRRFGLIVDSNRKDVRNESLNFRPQSMASDLTTLSLIELEQTLKPYQAFPVNSVYDSNLVECPRKYMDDVMAVMKETMERIPRTYLGPEVPFEVELAWGKRWGSLKEC